MTLRIHQHTIIKQIHGQKTKFLNHFCMDDKRILIQNVLNFSILIVTMTAFLGRDVCTQIYVYTYICIHPCAYLCTRIQIQISIQLYVHMKGSYAYLFEVNSYT
jgi:hypothetical protein